MYNCLLRVCVGVIGVRTHARAGVGSHLQSARQESGTLGSAAQADFSPLEGDFPQAQGSPRKTLDPGPLVARSLAARAGRAGVSRAGLADRGAADSLHRGRRGGLARRGRLERIRLHHGLRTSSKWHGRGTERDPWRRPATHASQMRSATHHNATRRNTAQRVATRCNATHDHVTPHRATSRHIMSWHGHGTARHVCHDMHTHSISLSLTRRRCMHTHIYYVCPKLVTLPAGGWRRGGVNTPRCLKCNVDLLHKSLRRRRFAKRISVSVLLNPYRVSYF